MSPHASNGTTPSVMGRVKDRCLRSASREDRAVEVRARRGALGGHGAKGVDIAGIGEGSTVHIEAEGDEIVLR